METTSEFYIYIFCCFWTTLLSTSCGLAEPIRRDLNPQLDAAANTGSGGSARFQHAARPEPATRCQANQNTRSRCQANQNTRSRSAFRAPADQNAPSSPCRPVYSLVVRGRRFFSRPLASRLDEGSSHDVWRPPDWTRARVSSSPSAHWLELRAEVTEAPPTTSPSATCLMAIVLRRKWGG